jgi:hypothetical protein
LAQTSAVHIQVEGRPYRSDATAVAHLLKDLERSLQWLAREGRFENDQQRQHLNGIFESAKAELAILRDRASVS